MWAGLGCAVRFDRKLLDHTIERYNVLMGVDGVERGSIYRYQVDGKMWLCRVGGLGIHGEQTVTFPGSSRELIIAVNAMINAYYWQRDRNGRFER